MCCTRKWPPKLPLATTSITPWSGQDPALREQEWPSSTSITAPQLMFTTSRFCPVVAFCCNHSSASSPCGEVVMHGHEQVLRVEGDTAIVRAGTTTTNDGRGYRGPGRAAIL